MNKIIFKKTACTFFLLACFINTVYGQPSFYEKLADSALTLTKQKMKYDPTYFTLKYRNGGLTHIGVVVKMKSRDNKRNLIVHNISAGQVLEDCLFSYKIIGHYRYQK